MNFKMLELILTAVALGLAVASVVLGILGTASVQTQLSLLGLGLAALALNQLNRSRV